MVSREGYRESIRKLELEPGSRRGSQMGEEDTDVSAVRANWHEHQSPRLPVNVGTVKKLVAQ